MKSCMMMIVLGVMLFVCGGVDAQRQVKVAAAQQEPLSHGHQLGLASYHARPSGFRLADAPAPSPAPILYPTIAEFSVAGCFGSPVRVVQFRSGVNLGVPVFTDAYLAPHFPDRCMSSRDVGYLFTVNATVAVEAHDQTLRDFYLHYFLAPNNTYEGEWLQELVTVGADCGGALSVASDVVWQVPQSCINTGRAFLLPSIPYDEREARSYSTYISGDIVTAFSDDQSLTCDGSRLLLLDYFNQIDNDPFPSQNRITNANGVLNTCSAFLLGSVTIGTSPSLIYIVGSGGW